jgi:hypothetical protein
MYNVVVDKQCSCFKKSDFKAQNEFENEESAYNFAIEMKDRMNDEFCSKHSFQILKIFDNFTISFSKPLEKSLKCCGSGCCK